MGNGAAGTTACTLEAFLVGTSKYRTAGIALLRGRAEPVPGTFRDGVRMVGTDQPRPTLEPTGPPVCRREHDRAARHRGERSTGHPRSGDARRGLARVVVGSSGDAMEQ